MSRLNIRSLCILPHPLVSRPRACRLAAPRCVAAGIMVYFRHGHYKRNRKHSGRLSQHSIDRTKWEIPRAENIRANKGERFKCRRPTWLSGECGRAPTAHEPKLQLKNFRIYGHGSPRIFDVTVLIRLTGRRRGLRSAI